jgi:hypothetical protein
MGGGTQIRENISLELERFSHGIVLLHQRTYTHVSLLLLPVTDTTRMQLIQIQLLISAFHRYPRSQ